MGLKEKIFNKRAILPLLIGCMVFYFLFTKLDLEEVIKIIKNINIFYFILSVFVGFSVFPLWALRWQILLKNAGLNKKLRDLTEILFLSSFISCLIPAKAGELYKAYLIKKNYKFSMAKTIGAIFVERLADMIFLTILLVIFVWVVFKQILPSTIVTPIKILFILTIALLALVFLMKHQRKRIIKILPKKIKKIFMNFEKGVSRCLKLRDIPLVIIYSILRWSVQIAGVYLAVLAIHLDISFFLVIFIVLVSAIITLVPVTPEGVGIGELAIAGILVIFNVEKNMAISTAILIRLANYWMMILFGSIVYAISSKK